MLTSIATGHQLCHIDSHRTSIMPYYQRYRCWQERYFPVQYKFTSHEPQLQMPLIIFWYIFINRCQSCNSFLSTFNMDCTLWKCHRLLFILMIFKMLHSTKEIFLTVFAENKPTLVKNDLTNFNEIHLSTYISQLWPITLIICSNSSD